MKIYDMDTQDNDNLHNNKKIVTLSIKTLSIMALLLFLVFYAVCHKKLYA